MSVTFYVVLLSDPMALSPNPDWAKVALSVLVGREGFLAGDGPPIWPMAVDGGFPQLGHPHDFFAGPFALPLLLVPAIVGVKALVVALAALGAAGVAVLGRVGMKMRPGACALAGALFTMGAAVPAYVRSGAINKSFLLLLPWVLVGYHVGGRRGTVLAAASAAAIMLDAGWAAVFGFVGVIAWVLLDQIGRVSRPDWRLVGGFGGLVLALSAGKLAGAGLMVGMPAVSLPKQTESVAAYFEKADFFNPLTLPGSLVSAPRLDGPLAPVEFDVFFLGLPAALLLVVGLVLGRRQWRLLVITAALFFLASRANASWGPFRLLLEVVEPARGLWKLDKYSLIMVAMVLSLWAGAGYDAALGWLGRRARGWGVIGGVVLAVPAFVANRPLLGDLFPAEVPPLELEACAEPSVVGVRYDGAASPDAGLWRDYDALLRYLIVRDGGVVSALSDFERSPVGARPCAILTTKTLDWRLLLVTSTPLYAEVLPTEVAPWARWTDGGAVEVPVEVPVEATVETRRITVESLEGREGTLVFNLPYHPAWVWEGGTLSNVDGQLAATVPPGTSSLQLRMPAAGITLAWGFSQGLWWLVLGWLTYNSGPPRWRGGP